MRFLLCLIVFFVNPSSYAERTNINELTDLFEKNIENKEELFRNLQGQSDSAINQISKKESFDAIEGIEEAEKKSSELNSIKDTELDNAGRGKRSSKEYQFYDENELEPDYTKSGNSMHRLDAKDIIAATENKMQKIGTDFMAKLLSEGFDCKTVKGAIQKEPTYYIEIKREEQNNTEYDQFFCEEPRNQYNCNDSVTLTCRRKGKRYGKWQDRAIKFNGHFLHNSKMNWGYAVHWKRKRWGWHITPYHPGKGDQVDSIWRNNPAAIIADARAYIAEVLKVSIEQIGEHVVFPASGRGIGNINPVYCRWRVVWDEYEFKYQFREAYDVCQEWVENWTERCVLK